MEWMPSWWAGQMWKRAGEVIEDLPCSGWTRPRPATSASCVERHQKAATVITSDRTPGMNSCPAWPTCIDYGRLRRGLSVSGAVSRLAPVALIIRANPAAGFPWPGRRAAV